MEEALLVFITAPDDDQAERISAALLDERLVACVNRLTGVHSSYWWQGARERAEEVLLLAKTRRSLWPQVLAAIRQVHSYEVFEAVAVPIIEGNPEYLQWIHDTTAGTG